MCSNECCDEQPQTAKQHRCSRTDFLGSGHLAAIAAPQSESKQLKFTALSLGWSLGLAWLVSFAFYQVARALGY
jgi:hypothetical protein